MDEYYTKKADAITGDEFNRILHSSGVLYDLQSVLSGERPVDYKDGVFDIFHPWSSGQDRATGQSNYNYRTIIAKTSEFLSGEGMTIPSGTHTIRTLESVSYYYGITSLGEDISFTTDATGGVSGVTSGWSEQFKKDSFYISFQYVSEKAYGYFSLPDQSNPQLVTATFYNGPKPIEVNIDLSKSREELFKILYEENDMFKIFSTKPPYDYREAAVNSFLDDLLNTFAPKP